MILSRTHIVATLAFVVSLSGGSAAKVPYLMDETYISASRLPGDLAAAGRQVAVLDSAEIARRGAASIADLLATITHSHNCLPLQW